MSRTLTAIATLVSLAATTPVVAQDWTGAYWGGALGYAGADAGGFVTALPTTTFPGGASGFLFSGIVGYNWDVGNKVILGVEGDLSVSDVGGTNAVVPVPTQSVSQKLKYGAALRVRAGYDAGQYLPFVSVGFASGRVELGTNGVGTGQRIDRTLKGYIVALGVDMKTQKLGNLRAELRHTNYGGMTTANNELPGIVPLTFNDFKTNELRVGFTIPF